MTRVHVMLAGLLSFAPLCAMLPMAFAADDNEMIVAGSEAPEGKYPYQVRLYSSKEDKIGFCGGSIIAPQWVLTAAHCMTEGDFGNGPTTATEPDKVVVGYGSNDRTKTKRVEVEKVIVNPNYLAKGRGGKVDLTLLKLKRPIPNAPAVAFADPDSDKQYLVPGAKVTITGWGALWDAYDEDVKALMAELGPENEMMLKWRAPLKLREVEVEALDTATCNAAYQQLQGEVWESEICGMYKGATKAQCHGDSGGPIVVPADVPGGLLQVGVVSWSVKCATTGTPSVFARVSTSADWINATMSSN
ncbi:MAG TPA: serine protease [Methyloceanibacter sp.]|nr:serine protease [Methyloceanibacter sp.]